MGIHPLRVAEGYEMACKVAIARLEAIADSFEFSTDNLEPLIRTCMTTLSSKMYAVVPLQSAAASVLCYRHAHQPVCGSCASQIRLPRVIVRRLAPDATCRHLRCSVGRCKREQAEMCVKAVLAVADLARKDVNLELIKVRMFAGSSRARC
jgi:T-complex protein 1 subunit epsilon